MAAPYSAGVTLLKCLGRYRVGFDALYGGILVILVSKSFVVVVVAVLVVDDGDDDGNDHCVDCGCDCGGVGSTRSLDSRILQWIGSPCASSENPVAGRRFLESSGS